MANRVSQLAAEIKAIYTRMRTLVGRPNLGGYGGEQFGHPDFRQQFPYSNQRRYAGTQLDFKRLAGEPVQNTLVMAAVRWFGTQLTEAPLKVYRKNDAGQKEEVDDHELSKLFMQPNPAYSGPLMMMAVALSWIVDGNVYLLKVRNAVGTVKELWYLPHFAVAPLYEPDGGDYVSAYVYRANNTDYKIPVENMVHLRNGLDPEDTHRGLSPLASLYRELYVDNERANFSAALLGNFGIPGIIIAPDSDMNTFDEEARTRMKQAFQDRFQGDNRGAPLVAAMPVKISQLGFQPRQMEFSALSRVPEERLCAVLGIPAAILGFRMEIVNYATMKELREQAYEGVVIPTQKLYAREFNTQLLRDFEGPRTKKWCAFDLSDVRVLQEDEARKHERIVKVWNAGVITRGEARAVLGYPVDETRDAVFLASAGTALVPEELADGQSLNPVVSVYDQQRDGASNSPNDNRTPGAAGVVDFPARRGENPAPPARTATNKPAGSGR